jgi:dynein assembly factor 1
MRIENLQEYTGLKVLYLEGNGTVCFSFLASNHPGPFIPLLPSVPGFSKLEGLEAQTEMRALFLQENCIERIEGVSHMTQLDSINLQKNYIKTIENLGGMTKLGTLNLSHNRVTTLDDVRGVLDAPSISVLDLQHNKIEDPEILDLLEQMPNLKVLYLQVRLPAPVLCMCPIPLVFQCFGFLDVLLVNLTGQPMY